MFSKPEICGKCVGPVGKGDLSASSTVANSRVNVVQDWNVGQCIDVGWSYFLEWLSIWNCCWKSYLCCEADFPIYAADFQSVKVTHEASLLTVHWYFCPCDHWSDFQISYQYIRIEQNKLNFSLTFWCSSTSGSSVSVSYKTGFSWSLLIYQNPFFCKEVFRKCLLVSWRYRPTWAPWSLSSYSMEDIILVLFGVFWPNFFGFR